MERTSDLVVPVGAHDHVIGPVDAPAMLVEYGDFECSFCAAAEPVVTSLRRRLGERLGFVFRHFPLPNIHPYAAGAALASEAAARQGQFWQMHDALYRHPEALAPEGLLVLAAELGLDLERFRHDLTTPASLSKVESDREGGERSGVRGTPSFFVNGARFQGDWRGAGLLHAIERALAG